MVDADQVEARLQRLEQMLERLDEVRGAGEEAYLADAWQRLATERLLQLAIQICIDLGPRLSASSPPRRRRAIPTCSRSLATRKSSPPMSPSDSAAQPGSETSWSISTWRSTIARYSPRWLSVTSLRQMYLEPLEQERAGAETLRHTLRAYFAAERNISSAAVLLRADRNTVASRLRTIEERIDGCLNAHAAEIEIALRLDQH